MIFDPIDDELSKKKLVNDPLIQNVIWPTDAKAMSSERNFQTPSKKDRNARANVMISAYAFIFKPYIIWFTWCTECNLKYYSVSHSLNFYVFHRLFFFPTDNLHVYSDGVHHLCETDPFRFQNAQEYDVAKRFFSSSDFQMLLMLQLHLFVICMYLHVLVSPKCIIHVICFLFIIASLCLFLRHALTSTHPYIIILVIPIAMSTSWFSFSFLQPPSFDSIVIFSTYLDKREWAVAAVECNQNALWQCITTETFL